MNEHNGKTVRNSSIIVLAAIILMGITWWLVSPTTSDRRRLVRSNKDQANTQQSLESNSSIRHSDDTLLQQGITLKAYDADAALKILYQISPDSEHYDEARKNIAHIMLSAGNHAAAAEILDSLLERRPTDSAMQLATAELWYGLKEWKRALPRIEAAISLNSDRADSHILLAEILDELGRTHEMPAPPTKAIDLAPDSWSAHILLAYAALSNGDLDTAEKAVLWCSERRETDATVVRYRAMLYRARGNHVSALTEIKHAIEMAPEDVDCRLIAADILLYERKAMEAYNILEPIYEDCRSQRTYLGTLTRAATLAGMHAEAQNYQEQLQKLIQDADTTLQQSHRNRRNNAIESEGGS